MLFETLGQAQIFLCMASCGAAAAAVYDLKEAACASFGRRGARISDGLFVAAACVMLVMMMARLQQEGLRGYVLLGAAVGWFLYASSVSPMLHRIGEKLRGIWRKFCRGSG